MDRYWDAVPTAGTVAFIEKQGSGTRFVYVVDTNAIPQMRFLYLFITVSILVFAKFLWKRDLD